jgi:hypothetical protein
MCACLLGAALLLPVPAQAADKCDFGPDDCGDEFDFAHLFALLDMTGENMCRQGKGLKVDQWLSVQQWLDWLPACAEVEDGGAYFWPPIGAGIEALYHSCSNIVTAWGGLCTVSNYPNRRIQLVQSHLGDALLADTDTYQFPGAAGSDVVIRLSEETPLRGPVITRRGDALLTLTGPDGASVVRRARSLLPVELRAVLPADGAYRLAVSQRAGSERSFAGDYRLTFRHIGGAVTTNAVGDVEACVIRSPVDSELDHAPQPLQSPWQVPPKMVYHCPGTDGSQMDKCLRTFTATISFDFDASFFTCGTNAYSCGSSPYPIPLYAKAIKVNKGMRWILSRMALGSSFGFRDPYSAGLFLMNYDSTKPGHAFSEFAW